MSIEEKEGKKNTAKGSSRRNEDFGVRQFLMGLEVLGGVIFAEGILCDTNRMFTLSKITLLKVCLLICFAFIPHFALEKGKPGVLCSSRCPSHSSHHSHSPLAKGSWG